MDEQVMIESDESNEVHRGAARQGQRGYRAILQRHKGAHSLQIATVDVESLYPSSVVFRHGKTSVPDVTQLEWLTRALTAQIEIIGHQPQFMRKTMGAWIGMEEEDGEQGKVDLSCETFGWKDELVIRNSTVLTMKNVERLRKVMQAQRARAPVDGTSDSHPGQDETQE
ncbi:hypothetical protein PsorP6_005443 [Peronosclerospora sorghi]|uniref:Uncharacterized protein n=1 Tax=Peronosclerospora sorghi TaxID=230839 RepID=A0ACC0W655_9STRA|nr:hypothetical protein PsorP6_005443 [Peronosclerospora sorghi]